MKLIKTIDLWTEQHENHYECFNGAFVDGFENDKIAFNEYKIVKNCNCIISNNNESINISNKHNAILFYKEQIPVRLMVINEKTDIDKCINIALSQFFEDKVLQDLYDRLNIKSSVIDMKEQPIYNNADKTKEIDVGSCDRWNLLTNMLQGLYTETNNAYGNFSSDKYFFIPNLCIKYELNTDLENISREICKAYDLGDFVSNELITIGYEDYNYYLTTSKGKYCVKIFSKVRKKEDVKNYLARIKTVANSNINAPKPLLVNGDISLNLDYQQNSYAICVFEFIDGKNYFQLQENPNDDIIKELARQTAMINNLDLQPNFIYDSWAIINFIEEYHQKREYVSEQYKDEFDKLVEEYQKIDFDRLPKAFVHGDIISTNVMLDKNSKIWIIDFAVSNYLPRIIDLAVISCNMCLDKNSKENTYRKISLLLSEYNKYNELTDYELETFGTFYRVANAMHILQTQYIIKTDGDSEENQYWLNEGIVGYSFGEEESLEKVIVNKRK